MTRFLKFLSLHASLVRHLSDRLKWPQNCGGMSPSLHFCSERSLSVRHFRTTKASRFVAHFHAIGRDLRKDLCIVPHGATATRPWILCCSTHPKNAWFLQLLVLLSVCVLCACVCLQVFMCACVSVHFFGERGSGYFAACQLLCLTADREVGRICGYQHHLRMPWTYLRKGRTHRNSCHDTHTHAKREHVQRHQQAIFVTDMGFSGWYIRTYHIHSHTNNKHTHTYKQTCTFAYTLIRTTNIHTKHTHILTHITPTQ